MLSDGYILLATVSLPTAHRRGADAARRNTMATIHHPHIHTIVLALLATVLAACGPGAAPRDAPPPDHGRRPLSQASAATPATPTIQAGAVLPAGPAPGTDGQPPLRFEIAGAFTGSPHGLGLPIALALDRQGHLYVVDAGHHRLR